MEGRGGSCHLFIYFLMLDFYCIVARNIFLRNKLTFSDMTNVYKCSTTSLPLSSPTTLISLTVLLCSTGWHRVTNLNWLQTCGDPSVPSSYLPRHEPPCQAMSSFLKQEIRHVIPFLYSRSLTVFLFER